MYSLYKLFELKFSEKMSEEKYAASLGTKAKQIFFLNICDYFKKNIWKFGSLLINTRPIGPSVTKHIRHITNKVSAD